MITANSAKAADAGYLGNSITQGMQFLGRSGVLFAALGSANCALELASRAIRAAFGVLGFDGNGTSYKFVTDKIPEIVVKVARPLKDVDDPKDLAYALLACAVITAVFTEVTNKMLGKPADYYNTIGQLITSVRLETEYRHPLIRIVTNAVTGKPWNEDLFNYGNPSAPDKPLVSS